MQRLKKLQLNKRILSALLCILALFVCVGVTRPAAAADSAADRLTVGVPADRCPVFYLDADTGENTGIGVDLMRSAAELAGYEVSFRVISEETLKQALDNPDYDLLMPFGSAILSSSGKLSIVSENLIQTPFTLLTKDGKKLPEINNLRVGMLRSLGGGAETVHQLYPGMQIVFYDTMDESVRALRANEVDALLHNSYVWSYVLQKPAYRDLSVQPSAMFSMDFRAGTLDTPEGQIIIERLNGGISELPDTRRQAITLDHTSRRLYRYDFSDYLYEYGVVILLSTLLIVSLVIVTILKRRSLRLEHEQKIRYLLDYDPMTGVMTMHGFRKRVEALLREHPDIPYLISYSNIKNFKYINDSLGMAAGDELLRFWAKKSQELLSEEEAIGRIEGDHIAVLRRVNGEENFDLDEDAVLNPVRNFFIDQGKKKHVQICSGVYLLTPRDYQQIDVDHMLDYARVAERRVRDTRKDGFEIYNPEQWELGKRLADVVGGLSAAIQAGEIQVWYQPQMDYATGKITGAEALCRWKHAKLGWLRPGEFIPTLEQAGLIYELDSFVWDRVCQDLRRWKEQGISCVVSVNLSRCDIREDHNIPGHFYDLTRAYALAPEQMRVEITETAFTEDAAKLIATTVKLREFGFQVEMDDFGSGYSSLHMLKEVPVDRIKLDLDFLSDSGDAEKGRIIVTHMVKMVNALGMKMIAEGVENEAQAKFLYSRGCSEMQGYYFYKPMPVEEFEQLMESKKEE